jgi:hypothetical protein
MVRALLGCMLVAFGLSSSGCGGVAERSNPAEGGQANSTSSAGGTRSASDSGSGGAVSASGQSSPGSGGLVQSCEGRPDACYQGCSAIPQVYDAVCRDGTWQCPDGSSFIADCPRYACPDVAFVCCDPATGATSAAFCDASGTQWRCPPDIDVMAPGEQCVVKPLVCRVSSEQDLEGKVCSQGDPVCNVGSNCSFCSCSCNLDSTPPVWACNCVLC